LHELAVVIVSSNSAQWLRPCLTTLFAHLDQVDADVVVVDNADDGSREIVAAEFPGARAITCDNHGFAHANNRALETVDASWVLFLNPDTEIREGSFRQLLDALDERPDVGVVGVAQISAEGALFPSAGYAPDALRALGDAVATPWLRPPRRLRQHELRTARYAREFACDWSVGSFLLVRRETLESTGYFDERFFLYHEEIDLCTRARAAGWRIVHLPSMTIVHHVGKAGASSRLFAQGAYAQRQYARKHFSPAHRAAYLAALALGYALRSAPGSAVQWRAANAEALRTLVGRNRAPFEEPPRTALRTRRGRD